MKYSLTINGANIKTTDHGIDDGIGYDQGLNQVIVTTRSLLFALQKKAKLDKVEKPTSIEHTVGTFTIKLEILGPNRK